MDFVLTEPEIRVIGCLVEKEITTPEYYPLSLNSLLTACNQKTNRDPVVSYGECTVQEAIDRLRDKGLVILATGRDDRVAKYDNYFADALHLTAAQSAVMCVLMLRGPQTPGEIKQRAERLYEFANLAEVEETLEELTEREEGPLAVMLPRQPGRKEHRYAHLLGEAAESLMALEAGNQPEGSCAEANRIAQLEEQIVTLRTELQELRDQFAEFKRQFE